MRTAIIFCIVAGAVAFPVSIRSSIRAPAAVAILVPNLALGLPVIDTLMAMLFRFARRSNRSLGKRCSGMFRPDRNHLHHLLVRLALKRSRIVIVIYSIAAPFCGMAFFVAATRNMYIGLLLVGCEILVVIGMRQVGLHADALRISHDKRRSIRKMLLRRNVIRLKETA